MNLFRHSPNSTGTGSKSIQSHGLPLPNSSEKTGRRMCMDWQLTPDPLDGAVRQGKKGDHISRDAPGAMLMNASDMCCLIRENYASYLAVGLNHDGDSRRRGYRYTGASFIVTGTSTDGRKFARLEVQRQLFADSSAGVSTLSTHVLGVAIARTVLKALNGLLKVSQMLVAVQEPIRALPAVLAEDDDDDDDGESIAESEITVFGNERKFTKG